MGYINIDVDLGEISDRDLLEELENRAWLDHEKEQILKVVNSDASNKMLLFMRVMDKYTLIELEEMFKEHFDHAAPPKEQLTLDLK